MTLSVESVVDDGVGGQDPSTALVASFNPKVARRRAVRAQVVGDQSGMKPYFLRSLRISFSVACLFRLDCTSTSRTSPSSGGRAQFDSEINDLMANIRRHASAPVPDVGLSSLAEAPAAYHLEPDFDRRRIGQPCERRAPSADCADCSNSIACSGDAL